MSNSLHEVKTRIDSTKSTAQTTKAMYMVSQSKVRRAEKHIRIINHLWIVSLLWLQVW